MNKPLVPHITEKTYRTIAEEKNQVSTYTFKVNHDLDKADIKKLIEREFKVTVTDVRTINLPHKARRFKGIAGKTNALTKALVRLKRGDKIAAFDIEEKQDGSELAQ